MFIIARADAGICEKGAVLPVPFISPYSFPFPSPSPSSALDLQPLKSARGFGEL